MMSYGGTHVARYVHEDGCTDPSHGIGLGQCRIHRQHDLAGEVKAKHADPEKRIPADWNKS